ncbi:hypothetical protein LCGC14_0016090 [marine sediment metagenome]|uniref:AMP-dependent synthetase/ligase domain-containing protein n=1 Tax=marine sediment metagenome TaxID=412755 RepID=A0A0F9WF68_9ZZZZ|nr:AMP-dependent synthetase [Phycisphaerae bacterium]HDZ42821.1 AMP-dependent synthetase [Phycisphaerae bacterium]
MSERIAESALIAAGVDPGVAGAIAEQANSLIDSVDAEAAWARISREILTPAIPFAAHSLLYEAVYSERRADDPPAPAWLPPAGSVAATNIGKLMAEFDLPDYRALHRWSVNDRAGFWETLIARVGITFKREYETVVDLSAGVEAPRWLAGARLNIVDSCFSAPPDSTAIMYQKDGRLNCMTCAALLSAVNRAANGFTAAGYSTGDRIAIAMPMTVESVVAYMGAVKAGLAVVSIADSFAPHEIAVRLRLTGAVGIITQDHVPRTGKMRPMYTKVVEAEAPRAIVAPCGRKLSVTLRPDDLEWNRFLSDDETFESIARDPQDHTNILFSSGTTGEPKAIPWTQTTPIKAAVDGHLHHDIRPGDVVAWPTNLGWMMGPWLIYAALINKASMALYDDAPTLGGFGQFVQDAKVTMLGVVPSLVRAWRASGCIRGCDWSAIRAFSSTGECSSREDMLFLMSLAGYKPIIEYCGGTEIGGGYITGTVAQPSAPSTFSTPALGLDLAILDDQGAPATNGEVFLIPPSMGLSNDLLNQDHHAVYFEGTPRAADGAVLRRHGDQIEALAGGYFRAHGRTDDTMNLGGIKISSAEIERTTLTVPGVQAAAAVAAPAPGGGPDRLVMFAVLDTSRDVDTARLKTDMQTAIKTQLNPLFKIYDLVIVDALPRTASNKVMRRELRRQYQTDADKPDA